MLRGPLGVRLVEKRKKGWRWGKETTVTKTGVIVPFCEKCPMRPLLDWRLAEVKALCSVFCRQMMSSGQSISPKTPHAPVIFKEGTLKFICTAVN